MIPFLDLKAQYDSIREEIDGAVARVFQSQRFVLGPEVEMLEKELAEFCQSGYSVGVSSGTDALLVSLMALGVGPGDEVITTPYTFFATAGSIWRLGAKPVFVDIDPSTCNLRPEAVEEAVSDRTAAIIPVHLFGQMVDLDPLMQVAEEHALPVIEDAAQSIGAEYKGRRAGSIGRIGCFSFFPSKNLGAAGEGGLVTTSDARLANTVRMLRDHGHSSRYVNALVGGNFRLDALQAAVLRVKLRHLSRWTLARQASAAVYREQLQKCPSQAVQPLGQSAHTRNVYNQFVVRVRDSRKRTKPRQGSLRDRLLTHLRNSGIGCEVYYPVPVHLQECFTSLGYRAGDFPASEEAARETLALPIFPEITREQIRQVVETIEDFVSSQPPSGNRQEAFSR